jgi:uncharacterized repeat protein (TIGR04138 family)
MLDPTHPIADLLRRDARYHFDAYVFIFEALRYAHDKLGMGAEQPSQQDVDGLQNFSGLGLSGLNLDADGELDAEEQEAQEMGAPDTGAPDTGASDTGASDNGEGDDDEIERHVSGQELCEAMRLYAHEQYGYMAKNVLNHWGLVSTSDFGEIVFNLIEIGQMRKTANDVREDFDGVFDFDEGFQQSYQISLPESKD